jgi:hypothetical protein
MGVTALVEIAQKPAFPANSLQIELVAMLAGRAIQATRLTTNGKLL